MRHEEREGTMHTHTHSSFLLDVQCSSSASLFQCSNIGREVKEKMHSERTKKNLSENEKNARELNSREKILPFEMKKITHIQQRPRKKAIPVMSNKNLKQFFPELYRKNGQRNELVDTSAKERRERGNKLGRRKKSKAALEMTENEALDNWIEWQRHWMTPKGVKETRWLCVWVCIRELWTMSTRAKMDENQTKPNGRHTPKKRECGNVQGRKMRFNTFIYATLAIHWTLCHRYLVFRGWFNARIYTTTLNRSRLHVIFFFARARACVFFFVLTCHA